MNHELRMYLAVTDARRLAASEAHLEQAVLRACMKHGIESDADRATVLSKVAEAVAGVATARLWVEMDRRAPTMPQGRPRNTGETRYSHDAHQPESVA
jgi:hypothetical protein